MILDRRESAPGAVLLTFPTVRVMEVQRRAMIDQPRLPVPDQHVCVARGTIDVRDIRVEPDDPRGKLRGNLMNDRVVADRSRKKIEREVLPRTVMNEGVDLRIRLGAREVGIEVGEDDLRYRQAKRACDLA